MAAEGSRFHLAVFNRGVLKEKAGSESNKEFVFALAPVMQIAEKSKGFVWRFVSTRDKQYDQTYQDVDVQFPGVALLNLSLWESMEDLKHFMYKSGHAAYYSRRHEWFHRDAKNEAGDLPPKAPNKAPHHVLWWVPAGSKPPNFEDAIKKCQHWVDHGDTEEAFTMRHPFPSPDGKHVPHCPGSSSSRRSGDRVEERAISTKSPLTSILRIALVLGAGAFLVRSFKSGVK
eukprot:TRINITY_DN51678_c0_g1_i1.p1 TRINITY_DN51678_c0_g1~~TRINITY_DN51678_c0_g1_i1.p1  ORF type:complete len:237 (-),score=45.77 TRINITY_DN51678_c0_g1_i1:84-773(-)